MNILVTGATGFIGKTLIQKLIQIPECHVFGLDNKADSDSSGGLKQYIHQDLIRSFQLETAFDYVFHLAALNVTHIGKADYDDYVMVNVRGTENLIKAVTAKKFVFMSTVKVYQKQEGPIDEDSPTGPEGNYERSKFAAEEVCRQAFDPEDLVIFRSVNVVGPGQEEKAVIPVFFRNAMNNEPLNVFLPRKTFLQMLYLNDLLEAFCLLIEKRGAHGIINLCPDETITLDKLAEDIIHLCHSRSVINFTSTEQVAEVRYVSKIARSMLGWQARTSIADILKRYYEFISVRR